MSKASNDEQRVPHPRETQALHGHRDGEATLLSAYRGRAMAHAWLIGGPAGIGKATLAYRMARFVLMHPDPQAAQVQSADTLNLDATNPMARQVAQQVASGAHGGLLTLERILNDKGVMNSVITVNQVRRTTVFFGSTAAAQGWRVCIVDSVEELNPNAANALLKVLEEPPSRSLFLLISRAPARVLPTIQSRCRKLLLRPLAPDDLIAAASTALDMPEDDTQLVEAAKAAEGSVARAVMLLGGDALELRQRTASLLAGLPRLDANDLHILSDAMGVSDRAALTAVIDTIEQWVAERLSLPGFASDLPRLARLAEAWEKITRSAREAEAFNLERKPLVFMSFGLLSEVMR